MSVTTHSKRWCLTAFAFVGLLLIATQSQAIPPINSAQGGIAIKGYDPVAYFNVGEPTKGKSKISHTWNGAVWHFSSAKNRDLFAEFPLRYAPQFGGYCAYAVSKNSTATINPKAWKIVDDKLYLNFSSRVQKKWEADIPGNIEKAFQNWPGLKAKP